MTQTDLETEAAAKRAAAADRVARYPDLERSELDELLRYLRKEATVMDRAHIASNPDVHDRYRRLCRDHHLDGLSPIEIGVAVLGLTGLVVLIYVISALARTI